MRSEIIRRITAAVAGAGVIATGLLAGEGSVGTGGDAERHTIQATVIESGQVRQSASIAPGAVMGHD